MSKQITVSPMLKSITKGVAYSAAQTVGVGATVLVGLANVMASKTLAQKLWIGGLYTAATIGQILAWNEMCEINGAKIDEDYLEMIEDKKEFQENTEI